MTYDLRPSKKPMQALGAGAFRADLDVLTSATNPLRGEVEAKALDAPLKDLIKTVAWGNVARGYLASFDGIDRHSYFQDFDFSDRYGWVRELGDDIKLKLPQAEGEPEEPFLHVILTHYTESGAPEVYHYSDIDRPVGRGAEAAQLDGRVIELGSCGRRFSVGSGLARMQTTIRLRNGDAELNRLFREPRFLRSTIDIKVGFRTIPPSMYRRIGPVWKVDRVNGFTAQHVELALIDATEGLLGVMQQPPTKSGLRHQLGIPQPKEADDEPNIETPFGGEWIRAFPLDEGRTVYLNRGEVTFTREAHRICLGVTKNRLAIPAADGWTISRGGSTANPWQVGWLNPDEEATRSINLLIGPGCTAFPQSGKVRFYSFPVQLPNFDVWHAAILEAEYAPSGGDIENWTFADKLFRLAKEGRLWVRWPHGAEGSTEVNGYPWRGKHDPASLMQHIARYYMGHNAHHLLHGPSFEATRRSFGTKGNGRCGGTFVPGEDGGTTLGKIAASWNLDLWWGADGLLHCSPQRFSQDELAKQAATAIVYDAEWDVVRDSWSESIPLGSERWGLANTCKHSDLKDYTRVGFAAELGIEENYSALMDWGRRLEYDASWTWVVSAYVFNNGQPIFQPEFRDDQRLTQRTVARFRAPLFALELECGDLIRLSHFAGTQADGGYERRLFRVEEVTLEWSTKTVTIAAVDMDSDEQMLSAAFDKSANWSRFRRQVADAVHRVSFTAGSQLVELQGPLFADAGVKVGDLILFDDDEAGIHLNLEVSDVSQLSTSGQVSVDLPADVSLTTGVFNVQRTKLDPPTDAEFPGQYPLGSGHYFCACESATGTFTNGIPGFRAGGR
ncbi:hypothetical protein [Vulgatibacter sp.]|uniref:hypothetical protein n=1 Tax=Vulgatibacter sp. TaxID=1971226 RepID=UPI00356554E3